MKVLHVITGLNDGGSEAVLYRLITYDPQDTHVVVSLTGEGKYGPLLRQAGVLVAALDMPRGRVTWRGLIQLWRLLRATKPDVVQTWMYHADLLGGLLARLRRIPVVWGIRNTTLVPGQSTRSTLWVARACAALSRVVPQRIVACAQAAVTVHGALGYDTARMVVIPNGYDLTRFAPDRAARQRLRQAWGVADDVPLIGMVARFDPQKDHANFIDALGHLARQGMAFAAVAVGTGVDEDNAALVGRIEAQGLVDRMRLLGPTQDVSGVMNALDLHVLSSAYGEAFPNVLAEAMACGTPCVSTDVGDAAAIVGETGWIVPPKDSVALAQAIEAALSAWRDRAAWAQRQAACRARISEHFSIESMAHRYRAVWQQVARSTPETQVKNSCVD